MAQDSNNQSARDRNGFEGYALGGAERAGEFLGQWGSRVGRGIATAAARVREEAEDIWAEAQSVRKGERD